MSQYLFPSHHVLELFVRDLVFLQMQKGATLGIQYTAKQSLQSAAERLMPRARIALWVT